MNYGRCPHDHQDEAEVPALEAVRRRAGDALGTRLTPVPFIIKAVLRALQAFPRFNASLPPDGNGLVMKRYFHIGVAVETPNGLVVPVIRDCERKSLGEIAAELADKAERARTGGLPITEMSGGCFSVSSLGDLGRLEELDRPVLLLASDASSYMNGSGVTVDYGHSIRLS